MKGLSLSLISIVDDDDSLRNFLADLIRSVGFRPQGFASADEFLGSDNARETDCSILDVRMPGMSGLELQRRLATVIFGTPLALGSYWAFIPIAAKV